MELSGPGFCFYFKSHPRGENRIHPRGDERLSYVQNAKHPQRGHTSVWGVPGVRGPVAAAQAESLTPGSASHE